MKLQQQRESLSKRSQEVAAMDRRVAELRERLWKKKAALQQKENLPVSGRSTGTAQGPPRERRGESTVWNTFVWDSVSVGLGSGIL